MIGSALRISNDEFECGLATPVRTGPNNKGRWERSFCRHYLRNAFARIRALVRRFNLQRSINAVAGLWHCRKLHHFLYSSACGRVRCSLPFSIAGPDSSTSAVTAALVASVTQHLAVTGASDRLLVTVLILLPMSGALTRAAAVRVRPSSRRPRDPLRAILGNRRVSRRDRRTYPFWV